LVTVEHRRGKSPLITLYHGRFRQEDTP
jgi:hypothetical protein